MREAIKEWWYFAQYGWWDSVRYALSILVVAVLLLAFGWVMIVALAAWT